jgi:hypothetical protein
MNIKKKVIGILSATVIFEARSSNLDMPIERPFQSPTEIASDCHDQKLQEIGGQNSFDEI